MVLNPYDLLGVTPNSTCHDVRKRYYALACLCHPDRGGSNEQMQILHNAFQYVISQVSLNSSRTFEELEADFAHFCEEQTALPPPFMDIHAEAFNLPKFNELFEMSDAVDGAFEDGGYAVAPSEATLEYTPKVDGTVAHFESQVVVYREPMPITMPAHTVRDLAYPKLEDFSCPVGPLHPSDYRTGLSAPRVPDAPVPCHNVLDAFELAVASRAANNPGSQ